MTPEALEQALRDLPRTGRLVKDRHYRQVWRFEAGGKPFYLKFYPQVGLRDWLRRKLRGSPALREFLRLQWLQKAQVPAPRAVATLLGFNIASVRGDAVIIEGLEPSIQLDRHLAQHALDATPVPGRRALALQLTDLLHKLAHARLGHNDLHLGNVLLHNDKLFLLDGYAVHRNGLTMHDLNLLALSASPYATTLERQRAWNELGPGGPPPAKNPRALKLWRELAGRSLSNNRYFGTLSESGWSGHFFKHAKFPRRWSVASRLELSQADIAPAFALLLQQLEADQFEVLKSSPSGEVLAGEMILAGRPIPVVVKRPRRKYWYRYLTEIGRGTRARRAWLKAWSLVVRDLPTAWPILLMERRSAGYATDALVVYERITGQTLAASLQSPTLSPPDRQSLLHRTGALLHRLESSRLYLYDAKADNWMVHLDPALGPQPMLIDVDGLRPFKVPGLGGFPRLLKSLNTLPSFTPDDALALALGYRPYHSSRAHATLLQAAGAPR